MAWIYLPTGSLLLPFVLHVLIDVRAGDGTGRGDPTQTVHNGPVVPGPPSGPLHGDPVRNSGPGRAGQGAR